MDMIHTVHLTTSSYLRNKKKIERNLAAQRPGPRGPFSCSSRSQGSKFCMSISKLSAETIIPLLRSRRDSSSSHATEMNMCGYREGICTSTSDRQAIGTLDVRRRQPRRRGRQRAQSGAMTRASDIEDGECVDCSTYTILKRTIRAAVQALS